MKGEAGSQPWWWGAGFRSDSLYAGCPCAPLKTIVFTAEEHRNIIIIVIVCRRNTHDIFTASGERRVHGIESFRGSNAALRCVSGSSLNLDSDFINPTEGKLSRYSSLKVQKGEKQNMQKDVFRRKIQQIKNHFNYK